MQRVPALVLAGLLLGACAQQRSVPVVPTVPLPRPAAPAPAAVPAPVQAPAQVRPAPPAAGVLLSPLPAPSPGNGVSLPAVQGLLAAADRALLQGDTDAAAAAIERAQRLAPRSAAIYQRLAAVRLQQSRGREAEQLARRGLAFTGDALQQAALWREVAAAREQMGRMQAAQEARARAAALEATKAGLAP